MLRHWVHAGQWSIARAAASGDPIALAYVRDHSIRALAATPALAFAHERGDVHWDDDGFRYSGGDLDGTGDGYVPHAYESDAYDLLVVDLTDDEDGDNCGDGVGYSFTVGDGCGNGYGYGYCPYDNHPLGFLDKPPDELHFEPYHNGDGTGSRGGADGWGMGRRGV